MTASQFAAGATPHIDLDAGLGFVEAVEAGIGRLFEARASDVTLQTDDYMWAYLDRRWLPVTRRRIEHGQIEQLVARFCGAAGIATLASGKPLDYEVEIMPEPGNPRNVVRARCNAHRARVSGNGDGVAITLRTIPGLPPKLDALNIEREIREAVLFSQGLGLIVGITGSGKSTLLASVLRERQEGTRPEKIVTIEAPIEFVYTRLPVNKGWPKVGGAPARMPEVSQVQIGKHLNAWEMAVPNVLRIKADVCVMGEMRDFKSVEAGVLLADTGHATYATAHTRTPAECMQRLIAEFPESQQPAAAARLLSNLRIIVAQKIEPTVAGPGMAFRSWVVFDAELKRRLGAVPHQQWAQMLTEHMEANGATFAQQALPALRDGMIDDIGFERLADFIPRERREFVAKHMGEGWISPAARAEAERELATVEA